MRNFLSLFILLNLVIAKQVKAKQNSSDTDRIVIFDIFSIEPELVSEKGGIGRVHHNAVLTRAIIKQRSESHLISDLD